MKTKLYKRVKEVGYYKAMQEIERGIVEKALEECKQKTQAAADLMKLKRTTLVEIRRRLGFKVRTNVNPS